MNGRLLLCSVSGQDDEKSVIFIGHSTAFPLFHLFHLHSFVLLSRERQVLQVLVDLRVLRDPVESLALLDHLDHLAPL